MNSAHGRRVSSLCVVLDARKAMIDGLGKPGLNVVSPYLTAQEAGGGNVIRTEKRLNREHLATDGLLSPEN